MESSRRNLLIDMVVNRFILKNNQTTLSPCFAFMPKTGVGLPKTGVGFCCVKSPPYNCVYVTCGALKSLNINMHVASKATPNSASKTSLEC